MANFGCSVDALGAGVVGAHGASCSRFSTEFLAEKTMRHGVESSRYRALEVTLDELSCGWDQVRVTIQGQKGVVRGGGGNRERPEER